jgi:excisionase family DNA binding protein
MLTDAAEIAINNAISKFIAIRQDPNEDITIATIADTWRCTKITVSRRIKDHKIPTVRLGREVAIKRKYLEIIKKSLSKRD